MARLLTFQESVRLLLLASPTSLISTTSLQLGIQSPDQIALPLQAWLVVPPLPSPTWQSKSRSIKSLLGFGQQVWVFRFPLLPFRFSSVHVTLAVACLGCNRVDISSWLAFHRSKASFLWLFRFKVSMRPELIREPLNKFAVLINSWVLTKLVSRPAYIRRESLELILIWTKLFHDRKVQRWRRWGCVYIY
jgi:hypothetical protein